MAGIERGRQELKERRERVGPSEKEAQTERETREGEEPEGQMRQTLFIFHLQKREKRKPKNTKKKGMIMAPPTSRDPAPAKKSEPHSKVQKLGSRDTFHWQN